MTRCVLTVLAFLASAVGSAADEFEREPINYASAPAQNVVSRLQERLSSGQAKLEFEKHFGYLKPLLRELGVEPSSQMLVFSKTSLQLKRISPDAPRAIYYGDDVYVGFCQDGDVIELSAVDPGLGAVFYTLDQRDRKAPRFTRQADSCLSCHASARTQGVPGHLVRSVYPDERGYPVLSLGSHHTSYTSPISERWGGWYVTGTLGAQSHLGNRTFADDGKSPIDQPDAHALDLADNFIQSNYLSPHSDVVALLVLEHQSEAHNLITRANYLTRQALHYEAMLNRELNQPAGYRWPSTTSRIENAGEPLVKCLLFCDEAPLADAVAGTSAFAEDFARRGRRDAQGRSLRDFDLKRRLFRFPCSYLIESESFAALPKEVKDYVLRRLREVLEGKDQAPEFGHLSTEDRAAILEILSSTAPGLLAE